MEAESAVGARYLEQQMRVRMGVHDEAAVHLQHGDATEWSMPDAKRLGHGLSVRCGPLDHRRPSGAHLGLDHQARGATFR